MEKVVVIVGRTAPTKPAGAGPVGGQSLGYVQAVKRRQAALRAMLLRVNRTPRWFVARRSRDEGGDNNRVIRFGVVAH